jgi:hypothetical protein
MTFDSETQNDSTGNDHIVLTATTSGNIQSRLSREEVAHLTAQDKGEEYLEWHFEIRVASILQRSPVRSCLRRILAPR